MSTSMKASFPVIKEVNTKFRSILEKSRSRISVLDCTIFIVIDRNPSPFNLSINHKDKSNKQKIGKYKIV